MTLRLNEVSEPAVSLETLICVAEPPGATESSTGVAPVEVAVDEHLLTSLLNVTVYVSPDSVAAVAPREPDSTVSVLSPAPGSVIRAERSEPVRASWVALRSDADAKSAASLPSTRSALRPLATPVALVENGAPFTLPVSMKPPSAPTVANSKARPPLRLLALTQGSLPALERQP